MTPGQTLDLQTILFFVPEELKEKLEGSSNKGIHISEQDIKDFFELSEQGKHKERVVLSGAMDGFNALVQGKRWRGIHMEMWEEGVLSGDMPYSVILEGIPLSVMDFAAKEMFKGHDADLIKKIWEETNLQ